MNRLLRVLPLALTFALVASTQLSCSVNDYCLNCDKGDGGGSGSNNDGGMDGQGDGGPDAGCVPNPPEICNGKDDDCNGLVDDNTTDEGGPCDNVQGACAGGVKICSQGVIKCNKQPSPEVCDGIDNNCSGPIGASNGIDEGDPGPPAAVGTAELTAQCGNGLDDDSDGVVDDGCPGTGGKCGTDQGECVAGQFHCNPVTGHIECQGFMDFRNATEVCNGKDDNCDGMIDNNIPPGADCGPSTNVGACEFGKILCVGGSPTCGDPDPTDGIPMPVFPKFETCNNIDDDCNGQVDEIFNKNTDIQNCGNCGVVCPTRANANTTCTPQGSPAMGTCGFTCKPGYKDLNGMAVDGCEFGPCFPTGTVEECDGQDNNCNGQTDEGLVPPPICLGKGECGPAHGMPANPNYTVSTPPTATCGDPQIPNSGNLGWICTYPAPTQMPETKCDGLDNNCDGNIDENQPNKGQLCHEDRENPATQCGADTVDNDSDGKVNDGCPAGPIVGAPEVGTQCADSIDNDSDGTVNDGCPETLAQCANAIDDDGDGLVNDGCPAISQLGQCQGTGTYQCDPLNLDSAAYCAITTAGSASAAESCDDKDNDCDGSTDENANLGNLIGQDWVDLGNGRQMMKYEASRPDSSNSNQGTKSTTVCSKAGFMPWTNVKYEDALAACQSIGAQLCTESQWHHACSVVGGASYPTYPISFSGAATYIEAEDYSSIGVGSVNGSAEANCTDAESAGNCGANNTDDDGDGLVNDGCPTVMGTPETGAKCFNNTDDDGDGAINDGCPSAGTDNDTDGVVNDGCAMVGTAPETECNDNADNDNDGTANDGCPAYGPSPETPNCADNETACGADTVDDDGDGFVNDGCPVNGPRETGANCANATDDDGDGAVNDGCPTISTDNDLDGVINDGCAAVGAAAEVNCRDGVDDDNDGVVNDGCPAVGQTWVPDYTTVGGATNQLFSGISAMEAVPNLGVTLTTGNAAVLAPRLDYAVNFTTAGTYHIWVRMFRNSNVNDTVFVGVNALPPPQAPTATATVGTSNQWTWVEASTTFAVTAGVRYVSIYMGKDGVKIDRIYLNSATTNPGTGETLITKGFKWAYASAQNTYAPNTCNGHDYLTYANSNLSRAATGLVTVTAAGHTFIAGDLVQIQGSTDATFGGTYTVLSVSGNTFTYQQNSTVVASTTGGTSTEARDPTLPTMTLTSCVANTGTGAFDMSGNVREWTLSHSPGESAIRGGASNGTADGISCPLNFTLADDTFFFPNIGFRCCR